MGILELGRIPPYQSNEARVADAKMRYNSNVLNHKLWKRQGAGNHTGGAVPVVRRPWQPMSFHLA